MTGSHAEIEQFIPIRFDVETSGSAVPGSGSGTSDASGQMSFSYSNAHAGTDTLRVWTDLDEDGNEDPGETSTLSVTWLKHPTATAYTGPALIADGLSVHLTALLTDAGSPIAVRPVTFTLGNGVTAQTCSDATNLSGFASCSIVVHQQLGPGTVSARFAGDGDYEPSSADAVTTVFAYTVGGTFVIGDLEQADRASSHSGAAVGQAPTTSAEARRRTASRGSRTIPPARLPAVARGQQAPATAPRRRQVCRHTRRCWCTAQPAA